MKECEVMYEHLKNMVEKVIEMKCEEVQGLNFSDMGIEEKAEYDELLNRKLTLENKLKEALSNEQYKLVIEYSDITCCIDTINEDYMFNRGVKSGLRELSFIKEELGQMVIGL